MKKIPTLPEAVYATICWFDIFSQPVSAEEVQRYLFFKKASLSNVKSALERHPRIGKSFGFYFLRGKNAIVIQRCQRQYRAGKLWRKVLTKLFIFSWTPFLRLAAVGNTLAMGWPAQKSDIDLLVVSKKERPFTARLFLTLFTQLFRLRRHGKKIAGRFCLSFFVADSALNFEPLKIGKEDPYLAFWLATLVPVFGSSAPELFSANNWIRQYFPNLKIQTIQKKFHKKGWLENWLNGKLGDFFEAKLKKWQISRARQKQKKQPEKTAVIISEEILKFHETDRRKEFLNEWGKRINSKSAVKK